MLIRSQDKNTLANLNKITRLENVNGSIYALKNSEEYFKLGGYSTEAKALKVLEMIRAEYASPTIEARHSDGETYVYNNKAFTLPQDSEV